MAQIIDFYAARERLRPQEMMDPENPQAFVVVELPKEVADTLHNSDHPDWILVLDYIIYGKKH